jgi:phage-related baseplate assembly protein
MSPSSLLSGLAIAAACLFQIPAYAGSAHTTFTVSARVMDACSAEIDAHAATSAEPATLRTTCTSGAASVSRVGPAGAVRGFSKGAPTHVTSVRRTSPGEASMLIVTLSF